MNPAEKRPFHRQYRFAGQFVVEGVMTEQVDMVIEFSELDGGRIDGVVLGDDEATSRAVRTAFHAARPCRIVSSPEGRRDIQADGVLVNKMPVTSSPSGVVAEFFCGDVTETIRRNGPLERGISFGLAGPLGVLEPREVQTASWTGERTVQVGNAQLDVGVPWHGAIELRNHYLWESLPDISGRGRFASVPSLTLGCDRAREELPDELFLWEANELADDATLLMSFAARQWVVWFGYSFWTPEVVVHYRGHRSRHGSRENHRLDDSPVGLQARAFLTASLPKFRARRSAQEDLRLPIAYWMPKADSRYVEERFAAAFWGLEKLVDLFAKNARRDRIVGSSAFKRVERPIKDVLQQVQVPDSEWGDATAARMMLEDKLPELNRPSIGLQLQWLCDSLDVTWRDLYPPDSVLDRPRFIRTRNEIFHSSAPVDGPFVLRETYRVSALFERLILRALDWPDLSATGEAGAEIPIRKEL